MKWLGSILLGVIIGLAAVGFTTSATWLWNASTESSPQSPATPAAAPAAGTAALSASDQARLLQDKLEAYDKRADHAEELLTKKLEMYNKRTDELERLLEYLIAVTAIYGVVLAVNAYAQADKLEQLRKDAEKSSTESLKELSTTKDKAKEATDNIQETIRKEFPLVQGIESRFREKMDTLIQLLPSLDVSEVNYEKINDTDKEQILFYEKTVAAAEYFELPKDVGSKIYRGLGNFYAVRSRHERDLSKAMRSQNDKLADWYRSLSKEDLDRARFYLNHAISLDPKDVVAHNDRGYLELQVCWPAQPAEAKRHFEKSQQISDTQQRPRYNLAYIKQVHDRPADYAGAIDLLTHALALSNWQGNQRPNWTAEILYNRACALARVAETTTDPKQEEYFKRAMEDLEKAFSGAYLIRADVKKGLCEDDIKPPDTTKPPGQDNCRWRFGSFSGTPEIQAAISGVAG